VNRGWRFWVVRAVRPATSIPHWCLSTARAPHVFCLLVLPRPFIPPRHYGTQTGFWPSCRVSVPALPAILCSAAGLDVRFRFLVLRFRALPLSVTMLRALLFIVDIGSSVLHLWNNISDLFITVVSVGRFGIVYRVVLYVSKRFLFCPLPHQPCCPLFLATPTLPP